MKLFLLDSFLKTFLTYFDTQDLPPMEYLSRYSSQIKISKNLPDVLYWGAIDLEVPTKSRRQLWGTYNVK